MVCVNRPYYMLFFSRSLYLCLLILRRRGYWKSIEKRGLEEGQGRKRVNVHRAIYFISYPSCHMATTAMTPRDSGSYRRQPILPQQGLQTRYHKLTTGGDAVVFWATIPPWLPSGGGIFTLCARVK